MVLLGGCSVTVYVLVLRRVTPAVEPYACADALSLG